ncbi:FAS1 domain-containing protein [Phlebopus sp. FC_14]|nr:FAS1 domain-containing protein [Phlebopus sp. FC_14]
MMKPRSLFLFLLACSPVVLGQDYFTGLLQALNASGLTQASTIAASLNTTSTGQYVISKLSTENTTLFAPTNQALSALNMSEETNATHIADAVSYYVVPGNFIKETATYPNVTIGRTLLNDSALVNLEGGKAQVLAWSKMSNGTLFVINNGTNITVTNTTEYKNTTIAVIDSLIYAPPNMTTILANATYQLTMLSSVLAATMLPGNGTSSPSLDVLTSARGITVFAPNNTAIQAAQSTLTGLQSNQTALVNLIKNHVINGTSVYSTEIKTSNKTFVSSSGENYTITQNTTGLFIASGGSAAVRIVRSDVLMQNGVLHVVDGIMVDTQANPAEASSA